MPSPLANEYRAAAEIATAAGRLLVSLRAQGLVGRPLGDEGDRLSHEFITRQIRARYPNDSVLSEEAADDLTRLDHQRVWIVDPLDGTREFMELGRTDWAVHVCLALNGWPAAGAVALPARGITFSTGQRFRHTSRPTRPLRIVVSRTRPPSFARLVANRLGGELVEMGSAGAKAMSVVLGEADIYLHAGGLHEWDAAAPAAVALAAGLHASRLDGAPLLFNRPDPWLPGLLICRSDLAGSVLSILREMGVAE